MDRMSTTDRNSRTTRTSRTAPRRSTRGRGTEPAARPEPGPSSAPASRASAATATLERDAAVPPSAPSEVVAASGRARRTARVDRSGQRPRAPRHRMLLVCTAVLAAGLFGVLMLNTIISQGAFRQHELEIDLILLAEKEEALARAVQQAEAPLEVERRARELGMVPAAAPVFLRLSDGALLGEPVPAPKPTGPVDFIDAPGLQPTPAPSASASAQPAGGADPATAIDPALDPMTGLDPTPSASPQATPAATASTAPSSPSQAPSPTPTPTPTPTTEGANP